MDYGIHVTVWGLFEVKKLKLGSGSAIVATAKKNATVYYKMVTNKVDFDPYIIDENRQNYL